MLTSKKHKSKLLVLLTLSIMMIASSVLAIQSPTNEFYVNDYVNVINSDTEEYIINKNVELQNKTGSQIVVVTVQNLEGKSIEEYSNELFRSFGIGDKSKNNGVLILLSLEERKSRIEVGYGLEGALPDGKTGRIQDQYMMSDYKNNDFDAGIRNGFDAILSVVAEEYNISMGEDLPKVSEDELDFSNVSMFPLIITAIISMAIGSSIKNKIHYPDKAAKISVVKTIFGYIVFLIVSALIFYFIIGYPIWYQILVFVLNPVIFIFSIIGVFFIGTPFGGFGPGGFGGGHGGSSGFSGFGGRWLWRI